MPGRAGARAQGVNLSPRGLFSAESHLPPNLMHEIPTPVVVPAEPGATELDEETARHAFQSIMTNHVMQSEQRPHLPRDMPQGCTSRVTGSAGDWLILPGSVLQATAQLRSATPTLILGPQSGEQELQDLP